MRVQITSEHQDKLAHEASRTGMGPSKLLRGMRGIAPVGLTSSMIQSWKNGTTRTAKKEHLDWVFKTYGEWTPPPLPDLPRKIVLSDEHRERLRDEIGRTGLGAIAILRHAPKPLPDGLSHQKVQNWISGKTKSATKDNWDFVLRLYQAIKTHPQK
ncbi:MAG: hypothetical protein QNJ15_04085 [Erythrobacter sp.]|nr:hypothetical protein [Erythrobacter sp.]